MRSILLAACLVAGGALAHASGLSLVFSSPFPNPGDEITLQVVGAPTGAQFRWDFTGDGRPELTTNQPWASWAFPAGYWEIGVEVVQGGKVMAQALGAIAANAALGAFRTARWTGSVLEVTVTLQAKQPLVAPGMVERVPPGWVATVLDEGGGYAPRRGDAVEVLWSTYLNPGTSVRFVYALYPPTAGDGVRLAGTASAYSQGQRVEIQIGGVVTY